MFVVNMILGAIGVDLLSASMGAAFTANSIVGHLFAGAVLATVLGWNGASDAAGAGKAAAQFGVLMGLAGAISSSGFDVMGLIGAILTGAIVYGVSGAAMTMAPTGGGD
jgi:hypothetical protein